MFFPYYLKLTFRLLLVAFFVAGIFYFGSRFIAGGESFLSGVGRLLSNLAGQTPPFFKEETDSEEEDFYEYEEEIFLIESPAEFPEEKKENQEKEKEEENLSHSDFALLETQERIDDIGEKIDIISQEIENLTFVFLAKEKQFLEEESLKDDEELEQEIDEEEGKEAEDLEEKEEEEEELAEDDEDFGEEQSIVREKEIPACQIQEGVQSLSNKIIFNEIAWTGTTNSANDEWIELKNISGAEIELTSWQILNKEGKITIILSDKNNKGATRVISPGGFWLLERTNDDTVPGVKANLIYNGAIKNSDESLYLFDENCQLQDTVEANPDWPAGDNVSKRTMERKSDLVWQTSSYPGGTPKTENSPGFYEYYSAGGGVIPSGAGKIQPEINVSFPENNPINKGIEVSLSLTEFKNTLYDLKIAIENEGIVLSQIYNQKEDKWQSSHYYLKEVFSGSSFEGSFRLKIAEEKSSFRGQTDIIVRVRENGKATYTEFTGKINLTDPEEQEQFLPDIVPPLVSFNLFSLQTASSFTLSWFGEDLASEDAVTSGIDGFFLQYQVLSGVVSPSDIDGIHLRYRNELNEWQDWSEGEKGQLNFDSYKNNLLLSGKDGYSYTFLIKAKDKAGNESDWIEASTRISLLKAILITEVQIEGEKLDNDFIELYNPNDFDVNLNDCWGSYLRLVKRSKNSESDTTIKSWSRDSEAKILARDHYLWASSKEESYPILIGADFYTKQSLADNNGIALRIGSEDTGEIIDAVGWGDFQNVLFEGISLPDPGKNESLSRRWDDILQNYQDTNNNAEDFQIKNPSPRQKNE